MKELEPLIPLTEAAKLSWLPLRRNGRRLAVSTLWRWAIYGLRGRRLETVKVGGQRCTTLRALLAFFAEEPSTQVAEGDSAACRKNGKMVGGTDVEKALDQLGIGITKPHSRAANKPSHGDKGHG